VVVELVLVGDVCCEVLVMLFVVFVEGDDVVFCGGLGKLYCDCYCFVVVVCIVYYFGLWM